jgi:transposase
MKKIPQQAFTAEFKELAVRRVKEGQTIPAVGRELGVSHQTVRNWVKAANAGKLTGSGSRVVTPEEMELSRLRAEVARLQVENAIIKKAAAYFAKDAL